MIHLLLAVIYVSFISLGLPDSLLGAAWPSIYQGLRVPVSYSGVIFCIISVGTVISSLQSDRLSAIRSGLCACGPFPTASVPGAWIRPSTTTWRSTSPAVT